MKKLFFFFFLSAGFLLLNAQNYWNLTGNAGTNSSNFIGTTDNQPLIFKTGGTERMRLLPDMPALGIGTTNPQAPFHLNVEMLGSKMTDLMKITTSKSLSGFQIYTLDGNDIHFKQKEEAPFYIKGIASELQFAPDGDILVRPTINPKMFFIVDGALNARTAEISDILIVRNSLAVDETIRAKNATITNALTANALSAQSANISGKVNIGTSSSSINLDVKGTIRSEEVRVCVNQGCDYVFEDDYKLMNLSDLHSFIKINKHLPDVAPAAEMEAEGINVSEMNALLLKKVEELTLYILQQNEKMTDMQEQINELKKQ